MNRVYISPSTQDKNVGVNDYGTEENRMNLIADTVVQLLQYNHFEVYRNKPSMTLQQAVADSDSKGVDVHFAIHSNAGGGKARGGEIFYKSTNGQKLASAVYKYLEPLTPTQDRGVKKHEHLYELNKTKAVAALAEVAFHDNVDDAYFIMTHIYELGEAIAHGICDYFDVDFIKPQPVTKYYIETGSFNSLAAAEETLKKHFTDKGLWGKIKYYIESGTFNSKESAQPIVDNMSKDGLWSTIKEE